MTSNVRPFPTVATTARPTEAQGVELQAQAALRTILDRALELKMSRKDTPSSFTYSLTNPSPTLTSRLQVLLQETGVLFKEEPAATFAIQTTI